ncbi:DUF3944 domain-containing protein [Flammeovirga sp. SJP92]|uniref:DUF3944 domain-containing protein n=1 Tax=Flammeovirga sp. SJP92 TaxID=1775430 RepID=UPI0007897531|nr:DUF3944 domain-containing protein [Flammeovirga sp. SJP92]KXX70733.1 hypothetical protein AVL50_07925 [Flammeovirga sp. SJP92]
MVLDRDLQFIGECTNEQLGILFNILCFEEDQTLRKRSRLLHSVEAQVFEEDYYKFSHRIGKELQILGNTTLAGLLRKEKVPYQQILQNLLNKLSIQFSLHESCLNLEQRLLNGLHEKALGIKNSGMTSLPFEILVKEGMIDEIKENPSDRCVLPAVIYVSLLRANLGKGSQQKGRETLLK